MTIFAEGDAWQGGIWPLLIFYFVAACILLENKTMILKHHRMSFYRRWYTLFRIQSHILRCYTLDSIEKLTGSPVPTFRGVTAINSSPSTATSGLSHPCHHNASSVALETHHIEKVKQPTHSYRLASSCDIAYQNYSCCCWISTLPLYL